MLDNDDLKILFKNAVTDSQKVSIAQVYYIKGLYELLLEQSKPVEVKNVVDKAPTSRKGKQTT